MAPRHAVERAELQCMIARAAQVQPVVERRLAAVFLELAERAHCTLVAGCEPAHRLAFDGLRVHELRTIRLRATYRRAGHAPVDPARSELMLAAELARTDRALHEAQSLYFHRDVAVVLTRAALEACFVVCTPVHGAVEEQAAVLTEQRAHVRQSTPQHCRAAGRSCETIDL